MPIPRLMNRERPGLIIGTLHKGAPHEEGKKLVELPYWRFTSNDPVVMEAFHAIYGDQPTKINVYLPYPTPDENFQFWCEIWGKSGLIHRCDGENAILWRDGDRMIEGKKPCPGGHRDNDPLKDASGRLYVLIPDLIRAGCVGYVQVQTKGKNDIAHIYKVLTDVYAMRGSNPEGLRGILFDLMRVKEKISVPGFGQNAGSRQRVDKVNIKIAPSAEWMQIQLQADATRALLPAGGIASLATAPENAPDETDDDYLEGDFSDGEDGEAPEAPDELTPPEAVPAAASAAPDASARSTKPAKKPDKPAPTAPTTQPGLESKAEGQFSVPKSLMWAANFKTIRGNLLGNLVTDDLKKAVAGAKVVVQSDYTRSLIKAASALIAYYEHGEVPAE